VHGQAPMSYEAKYIDDILDEFPVVLPKHLEFWSWVARYYCAHPGDVMTAALPPGLKLTSETKVMVAVDFDTSDATLGDRERMMIEVLTSSGSMSVGELQKNFGHSGLQRTLNGLVKKGAIHTAEELREKFKPKMSDFVTMGPLAETDEQLQSVFDELEKRNAIKQSEALMTFLRLSGWDEGRHQEVERLKLQKMSRANADVISALAEKGIFRISTREVGRLSSAMIAEQETKALSVAQQEALNVIVEHWKQKDVVLLHGVTSSGKTEVYAELIRRTLGEGKQVLYLLPEIALTTQVIQRLRRYFGARVGIYHSAFGDHERVEVWRHVLSGNPGENDIILGARSALFLPFDRLGLIIVDEEHDRSYKQDDPAPRYNARDAAIVLAKMNKAPVLLGSATPSLESYRNCECGKYGLVELNERFGGAALPEVIVSDIRQGLKDKTMKSHFGQLLVDEMNAAFGRGEQVILFQNRRGYAPLWQCYDCGAVPQCIRCDVSLTYHKAGHVLKCHYCGYTIDPPAGCTTCGSTNLRMLGFGTEKIEEDIATFFPEAKVQRFDLDTTRSKAAHQRIISDFADGRIDILVGTQMVTKGLDFDNVSVVGILNADKLMNFPEFRAIERSFQLMTQVAGRAGRRDKPGKVIIQTYSPEHWLFPMIRSNDFLSMYRTEMAERMAHHYPPYTRLIEFSFRHIMEPLTEAASNAVASALKEKFGARVHGPVTPLVGRVRNQFIRTILVKMERSGDVQPMKDELVHLVRDVLKLSDYKSVKVAIDVDPS
ncbi:MAG: primosomal protein N', partial [Flavobacteriales bacterium]|nr:primosomal protein N' [Flavobacteriales bacterium]